MKNTQTKKQKKYKVSRGDVWKLGEHRLLCGDATQPEALFVGAKKIKMIFTDPPYGVSYVENMSFKKGNHKDDVIIKSDHVQSDGDYAEFTKGWLTPIVDQLEKYNIAYIFCADMMMCSLRKGMAEAGWYYSQMLHWFKTRSLIGRKDYMPNYECIAYGWHTRHKHEHSKSSTMFLYPVNAKNKLHPTQKPVGLLRRILFNSTKRGDVVYDPFAGSGSTLIACEHLGRICYAVELEPSYVETIIKRWEVVTGKKATKI
jgi:site-specific DNA-methyltransferase (adenine-specific)